jgi:SAM-dependent methyltransferase
VTTLRADQADLQTTGAYYDAFADVAEERYASNHVLVRVREAFRRAVEPYPARSVLDIGCGTGTDLAWFQARYPGRRYAGIDVSPRMVERAQRRLGPHGVRIERACAHDIPGVFPDERFDLVYSFFGPLNTEPDLHGAVRALEQAVTPGGVLVLTFVNRVYLVDSAIHLVRGRLKLALARARNQWRGYVDDKPIHATLYSSRQLARLFAPSFRLERREGYSIIYPAWYRASRFREQGKTIRSLWLADRALNRTPLWSVGEHLLHVMRRV